MRAQEFVTEDDSPTRLKLGNNNAARAWIEKVYAKYPQQFQNNHVMPMGGTGDNQQFAMFELTPSFSRRGAVEVKWFQAYPLRAGVGSRAMKELQAMAREDGIALTLFPWDKGQVSQSKLTKFYKGQGFTPAIKGSKSMQWDPSVNESAEPQAAGCIIVAEDTGRWCLQQRSDTVSDPGVWATWGGGREPGETLEQTVRRELAEEGGYTGPLKLQHLHSSPQYATYIAFVPQEFEPEINSESKDWCWVETGDWPVPMHPGLTSALDNVYIKENFAVNEKINRDIRNRRFEHTQQIGNYTYKATVEIFIGEPLLWIKAYDGNKEIGHVLFELYGDHLESGGTEVDPKYRNKGIASTMYAYAKMLGNDIKPSYNRTDQGKGMWSAWEKSGDAKYLTPEVKENFADGRVKGKSRPGRVKRAGASCNGSVTDLRARAKRASGEQARMYHWCANMKSGRKK